MKAKLSDIVDAIDMTDDESQYYYNRQTGETVLVADYMEDNERTTMAIDEYPERYVRLPTRYEINDYEIMEQFIASLPAGQQQQQLTQAISGRGAFRYFRDRLTDFDLIQQWYTFKAEAYRQLAVEWCTENQVAFAGN